MKPQTLRPALCAILLTLALGLPALAAAQATPEEVVTDVAGSLLAKIGDEQGTIPRQSRAA